MFQKIPIEDLSQGLSATEVKRYSRHLSLSEVGPEGQQKLKKSKVLIVGAGGLGCPVGLYLAAAGIGQLGIIDHDVVEISNLQRQIGHFEKNLGLPKTKSLAKTITSINPQSRVELISDKLQHNNALQIVQKYDVIVDCSDNFPTRYLVNDAAFFANKPLVTASVHKFQGQLAVFWPKSKGGCYRCLYPVTLPESIAPT
ncbi:MAG: dinucleotide-utilizing protein [Deltaproteobacteria bacterium]|jgi:molybdopterin/thiamine biosynthesis adenylyltransferase|nr:dinucleotide-utilizing protein [Deltaproteobacteria bacterium]MBT6725462.1 dinucleotide-utilizing protein [Deltaproteobacteria bacterium]MBT7203019.1 dinucleotide-utilizing protein [Deltaproteobacteria bacterium]